MLSRDQLIGHVWGWTSIRPPMWSTVRAGLRGKIGVDRIETVRGAGYRFR
ncbi:winged helix-turn-helix domain-containing protein [Microbacterium oxydans]|nr:winged helix-turn-helix domain-containing protein [Microbacterium oxydans]